jgi:hypothetical protein
MVGLVLHYYSLTCRICQTKHRQCCLRPEVFELGLGDVVATTSVGVSGRQRHGVAKIDTAIVTWQEGNEK